MLLQENISRTPISTIIALIISSLAFILSVVSLYLQRRDKRPRLILQHERTEGEVPLAELSEYGTVQTIMMDVIKISAANPTEKQINIVSLEFKPRGAKAFVPPIQSSISAIPSHEARYALIPYAEFVRMVEERRSDTGKFILTDALGRKHKSKWFDLSAT